MFGSLSRDEARSGESKRVIYVRYQTLTVCCQFDDDGIRAEAVRNRAVVIPEVRRYGVQQGDSADYPLGRVFLLHVERRIVRREIELATGEAPHHRFRFWHGYRGALNLGSKSGEKRGGIKKLRLSASVRPHPIGSPGLSPSSTGVTHALFCLF